MRKLNWSEIRDEYVTGSESYPVVAKRIRVPLKTLTFHAQNRAENGGKTWGELRKEFRAESSRRFQEGQIEERVRVAAVVNTAQAHQAQQLREAVFERLKQEVAELDPEQLIRLFRVTVDVERRAHRLDRIPIEVSGEDGGPIKHEVDLEGLDGPARDVARALVEAALGRVADSS